MTKPADWSWNMKRAGIVLQMPDEGRITVQEGPEADPALRKAISALCKQFFKNYPAEEGAPKS